MIVLPLEELASRVEIELASLLGNGSASYANLSEAMRYSALGGGKRLRAWLVHATAGLFDVEIAASLRAGAAIELVHAYSLIHDDLPAMDDAALRRGKPTSHKAFDEATAILAGDALQALAFEVLARDDWPAAPAHRLQLVQELAAAGGVHGMCGGQMIDLAAESQTLDMEQIIELQALKTGALFGFACRAGGILGGADSAALKALDGYAKALGLAFQIKDDLLDLTGDAAAVGKDIGRDAGRGKATFPGLLGIDGANRKLDELRQDAAQCLVAWDGKSSHLVDMIDYVINREL